MNLVIDYGNSAGKVGIFDHQTLMEKHAFASESDLIKFLSTVSPEHVIISSVKTNSELITSWINNSGKTLVLGQNLPLPVNHRIRPGIGQLYHPFLQLNH